MEREDLIKLITDRVIEILKEDIDKEKRDILFLAEKKYKERYSLFITDWSRIGFVDEEIHGFKTLIIPFLSNNNLVDISLGKGESKESMIVVNSIMEGKKIIILEEGIYFKRFYNKCNLNFYNMMESYIENIKSFGIIFSKYENLNRYIDYIEDKELNYKLKKTLITQKDLENVRLENGSIININKNATITPLAIDIIKEKQWIINRRDT